MAKIVHLAPSKGRTLPAAIWLAGLLALLAWSLASWLLALAFSGGGDFVAAQAAAWSVHEPRLELAIATGTAWLARFGSAALWLLWALGVLAIGFGAWLAVQAAGWLQRGFERMQPHLASAWHIASERIKARRGATATARADAASPL